jgi:DNA-binding Lrp family transcriptional regulator
MHGIEPTTTRLLNDFQRGFPLEPRPYARLADALGIAEREVLAMLADLKAEGKIDRVGAIVRPNSIGASTLAAMRVRADRLEEVAEAVSRRLEVNHCYQREHEINLWFVVVAADPAELSRVLDEIAKETEEAVLDLPIIEPYHIDLGFDLRCG